MRAFFTELLARTERIELVGEPAFIATNQVGGMKALHVRATPAAIAAKADAGVAA
jgi:hypothetical protein